MTDESIMTSILAVLSGNANNKPFSIKGWCHIGSRAYIGGDLSESSDVDMVIIMESHILASMTLVHNTLEWFVEVLSTEQFIDSIWFIPAVVPIVKAICKGSLHVDLLVMYVTGEILHTGKFDRHFSCHNGYPESVLDGVLLANKLAQCFEVDEKARDLLLTLRDWTKARHIYGTQFGYPSGSAWAVAVYVYSQLHPGHHNTLQEFVSFFVAWPWPLPMTMHNYNESISPMPVFECLSALCGTIAKYTATKLVIPLPCGSRRNMTQHVGRSQHAYILHEMCKLLAHTVGCRADYVTELTYMAPSACTFLSIHCDTGVVSWDSVVASRVMLTLVPQLEVCGYYVRPLCLNKPMVIVLLPRHQGSLPLGARLIPILVKMLVDCYQTAPQDIKLKRSLSELMPILDVQCNMKDTLKPNVTRADV